MRIGGIDPKTLPVEEVLVLPRGDQKLVFRASGMKDMEQFKKLCPEPTAPILSTPDGPVVDANDQSYKDALAGYQKRRTAYIVINSLAPSKIEWDTVDLNVPATWSNWDADLKAAGLFDTECSRVLQLVLDANCLNEAKLQRARELFLRGPVTE